MNKAQAMNKNYLGVAPRPMSLATCTAMAAAFLYLPSGYLYESAATAAYTLYWCLSMVHNIRTGPPVSHNKARMIFWALTISVPSLGLALWAAATVTLAVIGQVVGWSSDVWAKPSYLVGLPFATASTMLYLGGVLEDVASDDEPCVDHAGGGRE